MIGRQQVLKTDRTQTHLSPFGLAQPRNSHRARCRQLLRQSSKKTSLGVRRHPAHRIIVIPRLLSHRAERNPGAQTQAKDLALFDLGVGYAQI